MCFSATASFGASAVLSVIGVAAFTRVQNPRQRFFAAIPLIFSLQQASEGLVWLALTKQAYAPLLPASMYTFLFFAQIVWPLWVPLAILKLDQNPTGKGFQKLLLATGIAVSAYLGYCLVTYPVHAGIAGLHITYKQDYPAAPGRYGGWLYVVATIVPPLLSRVRRVWVLGSAIMASYIITIISYTGYVVSVWCFFAALISALVYLVLHDIQKRAAAASALSQDFH